MLFDELLDNVERGMRGEIVSAPLNDHPYRNTRSKLNSLINLNNSTYVVFGGASGTGKTSYVDTIFVLNVYLRWLKMGGDEPFIIYRSMERPARLKLAKWLCYLIYIDHGILIDTPTLLQWNNRSRELTPDDKKLIDSYKDFFDRMEARVKIIEGTATTNDTFNYLLRQLYRRGKYVNATGDHILINGENAGTFDQQSYVVVDDERIYYKDYEWGRVYQDKVKFYPDNDRQIRMHISDHVGEYYNPGTGAKATIDDHGRNMAQVRDAEAASIIDIQQLNRNHEESSRKLKMTLTLMPNDFKNSGNLYEHADTVFGLLNPAKHGLSRYEKYLINKCQSSNGHNRLRTIKVIKNTYGLDDFSMGFGFLGECGAIRELPIGENMDDDNYQFLTSGNIYKIR